MDHNHRLIAGNNLPDKDRALGGLAIYVGPQGNRVRGDILPICRKGPRCDEGETAR
jgi:hypothetical protein